MCIRPLPCAIYRPNARDCVCEGLSPTVCHPPAGSYE
jgi:hypothetical protein